MRYTWHCPSYARAQDQEETKEQKRARLDRRIETNKLKVRGSVRYKSTCKLLPFLFLSIPFFLHCLKYVLSTHVALPHLQCFMLASCACMILPCMQVRAAQSVWAL